MGFKDIRNELTPEVNAVLEDMVEFDEINKPMHYNTGKYETFDIINDVMGDYDTIPYCRGNVLKYLLHRMWNKGDPLANVCLLYTSPSPRDGLLSRMPSSA